MTANIETMMSELDIQPVLIDIGAAGEPPKIWKDIAQHSIYVGFDPDLRNIQEVSDGIFKKAIFVNKAITSEESQQEILFHLTKYPSCSSTLKPDSASLDNYLFSDLFTVEKQCYVQTTTLHSVMSRLALPRLDWIKTDSQGIDLRIFNSLKEDIRSKVLAVDIEPGLIDAYIGEDLFIDAQKNLISQGFWLSNLHVCGIPRITQRSLKKLHSFTREVDYEFIRTHHKNTPAYCEARYLRTIEHLNQKNAERRDYIMLWLFSLQDQQFGFALDIALAYQRRFEVDSYSQIMLHEAQQRIKNLRASPLSIGQILRMNHRSLKQWIKQLYYNTITKRC